MPGGLKELPRLGLEDLWNRALRRAGVKGPGSSWFCRNLLFSLFVKLFDFSLPSFPHWWKGMDNVHYKFLCSWGGGLIKTPGPNYKRVSSELHCQDAHHSWPLSLFCSVTVHLQSPLQMSQNRIAGTETITHLVHTASAELNTWVKLKDPSIQWHFWRAKVLDMQHFFTPKLKLQP